MPVLTGHYRGSKLKKWGGLLPVKQHDLLAREAHRLGVTQAELVRRYIDGGLWKTRMEKSVNHPDTYPG